MDYLHSLRDLVYPQINLLLQSGRRALQSHCVPCSAGSLSCCTCNDPLATPTLGPPAMLTFLIACCPLFPSQTCSYFPQAASPTQEEKEEAPPPHHSHMGGLFPAPQNLGAAAMLPEKDQLSNQPVTSQESCFIFGRTLILVLFCAVHRYSLFHHRLFYLQIMYSHYSMLMSVLFVA